MARQRSNLGRAVEISCVVIRSLEQWHLACGQPGVSPGGEFPFEGKMPTGPQPGWLCYFFWQCPQNQAVRPPIVDDLSSRPHRGHLPPLPRCGSSHDLGMKSASAFASIAFCKM
jgi:hypothetical protein